MFNPFGSSPIPGVSKPDSFKVSGDQGFTQIQVLEHHNWRTVHHSHPNAGIVYNNMVVISNHHPGKRIRAVDCNGSVVDML